MKLGDYTCPDRLGRSPSKNVPSCLHQPLSLRVWPPVKEDFDTFLLNLEEHHLMHVKVKRRRNLICSCECGRNRVFMGCPVDTWQELLSLRTARGTWIKSQAPLRVECLACMSENNNFSIEISFFASCRAVVSCSSAVSQSFFSQCLWPASWVLRSEL